MKKYKATSMLILALLVFLPICAWGHQDVWLKNEQGDRITATQNSADPYSPRKTCGGCHHYDAITTGYHFQQGFDQMKDRFDERRPWILSPGMFGNWLPTAAARRLAGKANTDHRQMDLTAYDWIGEGSKYYPRHKVKSASCGSCHPGGGPLEYGRNAQGRADRTKNLIQAEALNRNSLDGDFSSPATPDGKSHFRESGVVEADCLICHMPGYNMEARNEQLGRRNYRWAATAGAGMGTVTGAVFSYAHPDAGPGHPKFAAGVWNFTQRPVTAYAWSDQRLFTANGRLKGQIVSKAVLAKNCLQCHEEGEAKNTGTRHTVENDAHVRAGFRCTDCHGLIGKSRDERLRHQIAKGRSPYLSVRNDLDGLGMKTCVSCHVQGQYRPARREMPKEAKNPISTHAGKFSKVTFHTYLIGCNGCHTAAQPSPAMVLLDLSTGKELGYTADALEGVRWSPDYVGRSKSPWKPWMIREKAYFPAVPKWMQWFGEKMPNGEIRPIPLPSIEKAARSVGGLSVLAVNLTDGTKDKRPSVLSDRDIKEMINYLTKTGFRNIVFIADQIYEMQKGTIASRPSTFNPLYYPIEHGVVPLDGKATYGGKGRPDGCMDCHHEGAAFFSKMEIKNIRGFLKNDYPILKEPNAMPQYRSWKLRSVPSFE